MFDMLPMPRDFVPFYHRPIDMSPTLLISENLFALLRIQILFERHMVFPGSTFWVMSPMRDIGHIGTINAS